MSDSLADQLPDDGWRDAIGAINRCALLGVDWDGHGADAPNPKILDSAHELLVFLYMQNWSPPCRVVPTQEGGLLVEWQTADRYLEAEFVGNGRVEWMAKTGELPAIHLVSSLPLEALK